MPRSADRSAPVRRRSPRRTRRFTAPDETSFYAALLEVLVATRIPFRIGGTFAVNAYLGLARATKDIDVFCRAGDYPRLLAACAAAGYDTEIEDERWIAKVRRGRFYCDLIFGSSNLLTPFTDAWLEERHVATIFEHRLSLLPPTELIWSKAFVMDRNRFDGADIAHLILKKHGQIDWRRLLSYMEQHWEVLLVHIIAFRYIYPSERDVIPSWLLDELISRLHLQRQMPVPQTRVCRGQVFSRSDYTIDIAEWGFADLVGTDTHS